MSEHRYQQIDSEPLELVVADVDGRDRPTAEPGQAQQSSVHRLSGVVPRVWTPAARLANTPECDDLRGRDYDEVPRHCA